MLLNRLLYTTILFLALSTPATCSYTDKMHMTFNHLVNTIHTLTAEDAMDNIFRYHYSLSGPLFKSKETDPLDPDSELAISSITYTRIRKMYFEKDPVTITKRDRDLVLAFFTTKENWPNPTITFNFQTKTLSIREANVEIQEHNPRTTDTYEMVVQFKEPDRISLGDKFWNGLE